MVLDIGDAIGDGVRRAVTYSGGVLMALMFVYQLLFVGAINTVFAELLPPEAQETGSLGLTLPVPVPVAAGIMALGLLFGTALYLVATRALTRREPELGSLPTDLFTRRIGRATVSAIGANIIVSTLVSIALLVPLLVGVFLATEIVAAVGIIGVVAGVLAGLVLVVPGVFLMISFVFVAFAIGVEDARAVASLRGSWELARGDRVPLFGLFLVIGVVTGVGSSLGSVLTVVSPLATLVASLALTAVFTVISYGILADAYLQLADSKPREPDTGNPAAGADPAA